LAGYRENVKYQNSKAQLNVKIQMLKQKAFDIKAFGFDLTFGLFHLNFRLADFKKERTSDPIIRSVYIDTQFGGL